MAMRLPARTEGTVYFESESKFSYHNDPEKTRESRHPEHESWSMLGDVGWVDEEGFLYLTDRKSFMIISGGVNIYPQEIENHLVTHPKVADVAVIGGPHDEMGEEVIAVVQPVEYGRSGRRIARRTHRLCPREIVGRQNPAPHRFPRRAAAP